MHILLQAGGGIFTSTFFTMAILVVIVFTMVIPQRRRSKQQKTFMGGLAKGQRIVTASGILGTIDKIDDQVITINVGNKTYMQVTKNAISKELTDAIYPPKTEK